MCISLPPDCATSLTRVPIPSYLKRALQGIAIREGGADFAASFTYVADATEPDWMRAHTERRADKPAP